MGGRGATKALSRKKVGGEAELKYEAENVATVVERTESPGG